MHILQSISLDRWIWLIRMEVLKRLLVVIKNIESKYILIKNYLYILHKFLFHYSIFELNIYSIEIKNSEGLH